MSRRRIPKSVKFKEHFAKVYRLTEHAENLLYCGRIEPLGIQWTEDERKKLYEAGELLGQARGIVGDIFAARIGAQAVREAIIGDDA